MSTATKSKPCPKCGKEPWVVGTLTGMFFVTCFGHLETKACPIETEAIALWNANQYEPPLPKSAGRSDSLTGAYNY